MCTCMRQFSRENQASRWLGVYMHSMQPQQDMTLPAYSTLAEMVGEHVSLICRELESAKNISKVSADLPHN